MRQEVVPCDILFRREIQYLLHSGEQLR